MESVKRIKLDCGDKSIETSALICKSILPDELLNLPQLVDFYIGSIEDTKVISKILPQLNEILPIQQIQFLKRVNKREILLCSKDHFDCLVSELGLNSDDPIDELFRKLFELKGISSELSVKICSSVRLVQVPNDQPILRWQYEQLKDKWPCKFHENKYLESLTKSSVFNQREHEANSKFMKIILFLSRILDNRDVGISVNPYTKKIVAMGYTKIEENPLFHSPAVLIDEVAITQGGGVWAKGHDEKYTELIEKILEKFPDVEFGEDLFDKEAALKMKDQEDNLLKYGPYLCTGYYIYLTKEPCLMCAMALTHSRAKRVFYHKANNTRGALRSLTKLHTNRNLNHHYEVFQMC